MICAASVRLGRHEAEMVQFAKRNAASLNRLASAFISVSLSEAGVEDLGAPAEHRAEARADVDSHTNWSALDEFVDEFARVAVEAETTEPIRTLVS